MMLSRSFEHLEWIAPRARAVHYRRPCALATLQWSRPTALRLNRGAVRRARRRTRRPVRPRATDSMAQAGVVLHAASGTQESVRLEQPPGDTVNDDNGIAETRRYDWGCPRYSACGRSCRGCGRLPRWRTRRHEATWTSKRNGSQASTKGPAKWFTGTVRIDRLFDAPHRHGRQAPPHLRARRPNRVARAPTRTDADRDGRCGPRAAVGRTGRRDQAWGRGVVPAERKALARRVPHDRHDPHRDRGELDGKMVDSLEHVTANQYGG